MRNRFYLILAIACVLGFSAFGQARIKVACVGNSITEGFGLSSREQSYPSVLQQLLGDSYEVGNFGVSARTLLAKGDRPYRNERKFRESQEFLPDIVIIKLGTNDTKPENWDAHSVEIEGDLRELVSVYKNLPSEPKIYLCFPIWIGENRWNIREGILAAHIIPAIEKIAKETGASVIDLHATLYGMQHLMPDGVHPNATGAVLIAKDVYDRIK